MANCHFQLHAFLHEDIKNIMLTQKIQIQETTAKDFNHIMNVEEKAFGSMNEAHLTADLLGDETAEPVLSLLAYDDEKAVGHILFTRAYMNQINVNQPLIHILAPLAVVPEYQKKGIGGLLINNGLNKLKAIGSEMVFVLGHIEYYPKFGFIPDAKQKGYLAPFSIPEMSKDAWMVQSLTSEDFDIPGGKVVCANELNKPEYWRE